MKLKIGLNTGFVAPWNLQIILTPLQLKENLMTMFYNISKNNLENASTSRTGSILQGNQVKSWLLLNLFNFFSDFQPFVMVLIFFVLVS